MLFDPHAIRIAHSDVLHYATSANKLTAIRLVATVALGLAAASDDGLNNINAQFQYDKIGSTARKALMLDFERKF